MKFSLVFILILFAGHLRADEFCLYKDDDGSVKQVKSIRKVPFKFKKMAICRSSETSAYLANPEEIELKGTTRKESMATSLGRVELRWPRVVETLFGRTPQKAVSDAAATASRVLKQSGFPSALKTLDLDWQIVFMDEKLPEAQIPSYLVSNCHPAWMTPPGNIYVVSQRITAACSGQKVSRSVADATLAQVLLHEIGHAIEFRLLGESRGDDKFQREGFATWFEQYSADFSTLIPKGKTKKYYANLAQESFKRNPDGHEFSNDAYGYARASMYFRSIEEKYGVNGLMDVYKQMSEKGNSFFQAAEERYGWDDAKFAKEIARLIKP